MNLKSYKLTGLMITTVLISSALNVLGWIYDFFYPLVPVACLLVGYLLGAKWERIWQWLFMRRVCKWYHAPRRLGGNPFAKTITHGMCRQCEKHFYERMETEHHNVDMGEL